MCAYRRLEPNDWEKIREQLAPDIFAVVTSMQPMRHTAELKGIDNYMDSKIKGGQLVEPGSAHVISTVGDDTNALVLATMKISLGPNGMLVKMQEQVSIY